jgi:hypothetical protein
MGVDTRGGLEAPLKGPQREGGLAIVKSVTRTRCQGAAGFVAETATTWRADDPCSKHVKLTKGAGIITPGSIPADQAARANLHCQRPKPGLDKNLGRVCVSVTAPLSGWRLHLVLGEMI